MRLFNASLPCEGENLTHVTAAATFLFNVYSRILFQEQECLTNALIG